MRQALVTGASGGIGEALCRALADRGYDVLAHARTREKASAAGPFTPIHGDVTNPHDVANIADQVARIGCLDLVVHNAGVLTRDTSIGPHGFGPQGEVNVIAPWTLTQALVKANALNDGALVLVNASSAANLTRSTDYEALAKPDGSALFGQYALSKAAANALAVHMAKTFPGLRIVSVEPGFVKTKMTAGNSSMPWFMRTLAPMLGSKPDKASSRVLDHALSNDLPSGTVVQGSKVVDGRWSAPEAQASIRRLLELAGVAGTA